MCVWVKRKRLRLLHAALSWPHVRMGKKRRVRMGKKKPRWIFGSIVRLAHVRMGEKRRPKWCCIDSMLAHVRMGKK